MRRALFTDGSGRHGRDSLHQPSRSYNLIHDNETIYSSVNYVTTQDNSLRDTAAPLGRCRNSWAPQSGSSAHAGNWGLWLPFQTYGNDDADAAIIRRLMACMMGPQLAGPGRVQHQRKRFSEDHPLYHETRPSDHA